MSRTRDRVGLYNIFNLHFINHFFLFHVKCDFLKEDKRTARRHTARMHVLTLPSPQNDCLASQRADTQTRGTVLIGYLLSRSDQ